MIPPHPQKVGINLWLNRYGKGSLEENTVKFNWECAQEAATFFENYDRYRAFWIKFNCIF